MNVLPHYNCWFLCVLILCLLIGLVEVSLCRLVVVVAQYNGMRAVDRRILFDGFW